MSGRPYETGDVVWAPDPFHVGDPALDLDDARPWLVVSVPQTYPPHGVDYLCAALTSNVQTTGNFIPLAARDWMRGGPPKPSAIDPETLVTVKHDETDGWIGKVADGKVNQARRIIRGFFG